MTGFVDDRPDNTGGREGGRERKGDVQQKDEERDGKEGRGDRMEEKSDMNGKLVMYVLFHPPFSQSEMQLSRASLCCTDRLLVSYFFSTCAEHNNHHTHSNVELLQCIFRTDFSTSSD